MRRPGALYVALMLAVFAILFGTRRIDATEHHHGMVLAIALESLVKGRLRRDRPVRAGASARQRRHRHPHRRQCSGVRHPAAGGFLAQT